MEMFSKPCTLRCLASSMPKNTVSGSGETGLLANPQSWDCQQRSSMLNQYLGRVVSLPEALTEDKSILSKIFIPINKKVETKNKTTHRFLYAKNSTSGLHQKKQCGIRLSNYSKAKEEISEKICMPSIQQSASLAVISSSPPTDCPTWQSISILLLIKNSGYRLKAGSTWCTCLKHSLGGRSPTIPSCQHSHSET